MRGGSELFLFSVIAHFYFHIDLLLQHGVNVHGFDEGPGQTYWVGLDGRSFGIRIADYIVKCKNKAIYDEYISFAKSNPTKFLYKMREDSRMNYRYGDDVNIEFIFKWGGEEKTFDVHLSTDSYAEEK